MNYPRTDPDEEFFERFKRGPQNAVNKTGVVRTPMIGRPLNTSQFQMASLRDRVPRKKRSRKKVKQVASIPKEKFKIPGFGSTSGLTGNLIDAILGAVLLFIVTSGPVKSIMANFISGFYKTCENKYMMNNGVMDAGALPGTIVIKSSSSVSLKGKIILMGIFIVLFLAIKTWFITES